MFAGDKAQSDTECGFCSKLMLACGSCSTGTGWALALGKPRICTYVSFSQAYIHFTGSANLWYLG